MSSHHIVRDNQEPALILLDGDASMYSSSQDLLEWCPAIIVHEHLLDEVLLWGIKIDVVLFDETHRDAVIEKINDQIPVKLISYKPFENSIEAALNFLHRGKYSSLNIISNQKEIFPVLEKFDNTINIVVIQNNYRWSLIRSHHFEKWVTSETNLILKRSGEEQIIFPDERNRISIHHSSVFWVGESL
jgi:hypothetical protein